MNPSTVPIASRVIFFSGPSPWSSDGIYKTSAYAWLTLATCQPSETDSPAKVPVFSWTNRDHLSLDAFDAKINRIAGLFVVSQDVLLAQAHEGCETDVEAGRRFL